MPAVVVPKIEMEIAARAIHTGIWVVACPECDWFPEPYFDEEVAQQDGYQHNRLRHEGAGVELMPSDPMRFALNHERWLSKVIRGNYMWLAVIIVSYTTMIGAFVSADASILFLILVLPVFVQGQTIGKWTERRVQERAEITQMQNAHDIEVEPPDDAG